MNKQPLTEENIKTALKGIYDPEIPANIVDLGLIYAIEILPDKVVDITMTLTAAGCPMMAEFMERIKDAIMEQIEEVKHVNVDITFDPPWNPSMITQEVLFELGIQKT
jgi:metal-sulfur cluster biosynthetic enzyme